MTPVHEGLNRFLKHRVLHPLGLEKRYNWLFWGI